MARLSLFERRRRRVRTALKARAGGRPRLSVHRSGRHIYAQLIDDAAERSHADETLVALFKSSFAQLQGAAPTKAADTPLDPTSAVEAGLTEKAQPLLSGLVDFEASFSGDFAHANRWGSTNEKGHAQYAISQKTAVEVDHKLKTVDIAQTQSEQLQSRYAKARFDGVLDTQSGNFDRYSVQDRSTVTTLINAAQGTPLSAARTTDRGAGHA